MNMGKCLQVEGDFRIKIGFNTTLQCLAFIGARSNSMSHSLNSMHRRSAGRSTDRVGKLSTTLSSNSMHRSLRVALQVALENSTQHSL